MSKQSDEEREHAHKFVDYVNRRGGRVVLEQIAKPITEIESPLKALEAVLALEKDVTTKIEQLYEVSNLGIISLGRRAQYFMIFTSPDNRHLARPSYPLFYYVTY